MHELHLVGFTADHDGLIFSIKKGAETGAYVVGLDDALFATLEQARRRVQPDPEDAAARAAAERVRTLRLTRGSKLSVREIQSRLRSGMTLGQVAVEAGVDEAWVARFADPVMAEQGAIVERATKFSLTTMRKGPSSRPLGEAVRWNLGDRGVVLDNAAMVAGWSAFQLEPGRWVVRFTYTSRRRDHVAEWDVDLENSVLSARNRLASDLAYVEVGARVRSTPELTTPEPAPPPKKATAGRKGTPARTETARMHAAQVTSSQAAARAYGAKPPVASRPAPARAAASAAVRPATPAPARPTPGPARPTAAPPPRPSPPAKPAVAPAAKPRPAPVAKPAAPTARVGVRPVTPAAKPVLRPPTTRRIAPPEQSVPTRPSGNGAPTPRPEVPTAAPPVTPTPSAPLVPAPKRATGRPRPPEPTPRVIAPEPVAPTPEPPPQVVSSRPVPSKVRPVGGGDGRPAILIINADRAGDRRRS